MADRSDPRAPENVTLYHPPPPPADAEKPADVYALCSLGFGVLSMMLRNKYCAWLTIFSTLMSLANTRKQDFDWKQTGFSILFAVMGLVINYTGLRDPSKPGSATQTSIFQHFLT